FDAYFVHRIGSCTACDRRIRIENFAAVDPNLYADDTERRQCFSKTVIDIGAKRMKRQASLQRPFGAGDLGSVQTAGDHYLDALCSETLRFFHRLFHRTAKSDTFFELLGDLFGLKLCVKFRMTDLLDRDLYFAAGL